MNTASRESHNRSFHSKRSSATETIIIQIVIHVVLLLNLMLSVFLSFHIVVLNSISIDHNIEASCSDLNWLSEDNPFRDSS